MWKREIIFELMDTSLNCMTSSVVEHQLKEAVSGGVLKKKKRTLESTQREKLHQQNSKRLCIQETASALCALGWVIREDFLSDHLAPAALLHPPRPFLFLTSHMFPCEVRSYMFAVFSSTSMRLGRPICVWRGSSGPCLVQIGGLW